VLLDGERRRAGDLVDAHAGPLLAFARGLVARRPVDVIHAHTGLPDGIAALRVADELDLPLLVTEHASTTADELVDDEARDLYRRLVAPPRRVVAVSRALAHDVARALGIGDDEIAVLPNAVPVDGFPLGAAADRDPNELLYVGSRKASKGIENLLRAFAEVHAHRAAIRLRLIGSPGQAADEARWTALATELDISASVAFEPAAPREAVAAAMRRAALFVHPSPRETFGMVAAEALASGLPVAATPSGGVDEIVGRDSPFGAIATSTAVPALADAIDRALAGSRRVNRTAMRAHIEANYAAPAVAQRTLEMYGSVAAQTRRRPMAAGGAGMQAVGRTDVATGAAAAERPSFRLPLVVALARGQAIERAGLLPVGLRDRLTIVTSPRGRYADDRDLPPWGRWLELDQDQFYRDALAALEQSGRPASGFGRLKAAFGGPNLDRMRKDLAARKEHIRRDETRRYLEEAASAIGPPNVVGRAAGAIEPARANAPAASAEPRWVVALDADDIILAAQLDPSTCRLAPGGLRWLADAWDAAGRPA
jgi:glycosyltransferase involved in cell wall biosynthesis